MSLIDDIRVLNLNPNRPKHELFNELVKLAHSYDFTIDDVDINKPWGLYMRFEPADAERFVSEFFPGLSMNEAQLGNPNAPLSPKFLLVSPSELLSWQYHNRRAERWVFLSRGGFYKSLSDEQGELHIASPDEIVQFAQGERHRLVGAEDLYTLVAEIWQHTDQDNLSDEADIIRLVDKYSR